MHGLASVGQTPGEGAGAAGRGHYHGLRPSRGNESALKPYTGPFFSTGNPDAMNTLRRLGLACCLALPFPSAAAEPPGDAASAPPRLEFTPPIRRAFDRSGKAVVHRRFPDGSSMAEHNATLGHVTLARIGPDGSIETYCTTDEADAGAWLSRAAGPSGPRTSAAPPVGKPR